MVRISFAIIFAMFFYVEAFCQVGHVAFKENFNSGPPKWQLLNDTNTARDFLFKPAWIRLKRENAGDSCAASTSYFTKIIAASRWMIFGPFKIEQDAILYWEAQANNYTHADGYEIYVSRKVDFNDGSKPILSIKAEADYWKKHQLSLSTFGFEKEDIYLAFKQNSRNKDVILIDNIEVRDTSNILHDLAIMTDSTKLGFNLFHPYGQGASPPVSVVIRNSGSVTSDGNLLVEVFNINSQKITSKKINIPELIPNETFRTKEMFFPELSDTGDYRFRIKVDNDDRNSNNFFEFNTGVGSTFSSARPEKVTPFEIDYSTPGMVGTSYKFIHSETLVALEYWVDNESGKYTGTNIYGRVFEKNDKGKFSINDPIVETDTVKIKDKFKGNVRLTFPKGFVVNLDTQEKPVELLFAVGRDSYEAFKFSRDEGSEEENGIQNHVYAGAQTNYDWMANDGINVKGNFGVTVKTEEPPCYLEVLFEFLPSPTIYKFTGNPKSDSIVHGKIHIKSVENGIPPYKSDYRRSLDDVSETFDIPDSILYGSENTSGLQVSVNVVDAVGCRFYAFFSEDFEIVYKENTSRVYDITSVNAKVWPNPAETTLHFSENLMFSTVLIFDVNGKKVHEQKITENNKIDIQLLPTGIYTGLIKQNDVNSFFRLIKQ